MGWFSKIVKKVKKISTPWASKDNAKAALGMGFGYGGIGTDIAKAGLKGTKNIYEGISGQAQAEAIAAAQAKAAEEARIARVRASQASQFASNDSDDQSGDVVLGTGEVDESLEEQLKRMRGK